MNAENMIEAVTDDAATFATTMFYRSQKDILTSVLEQEGSVALISEGRMQGKHDTWRALYETHVDAETLVLMVAPNKPAAQGFILSIGDEIERSPFDSDLWGIERSTQTEIEFDNGSRITTACIGEHMQNEPENIRGFAPDLLIVNDWEEEGATIPQETIDHVLAPMANRSGTDLWLNATELRDDTLFDVALESGVYVTRMNH